eukprot:3478399-Prymnesium_polylepis.2
MLTDLPYILQRVKADEISLGPPDCVHLEICLDEARSSREDTLDVQLGHKAGRNGQDFRRCVLRWWCDTATRTKLDDRSSLGGTQPHGVETE